MAGDQVVDRWTGRGTHEGELMGITATGRAVTASGISIHRIADDRLAETWNIYDAVGTLRQLGAISGMKSED
jgi:predicted ester cyclase